ncbi:hypothetical protein CAS74_000750 [Pichia kudriavzevii]|uniref:Uncharacterized protein n=1 Tax=Pichia kudriavzevii TaxID=4909 RepID=A0A1Z8JV78_PICKU|nr:hypothetical protein CAS74_000750 [Pichia kudriavzevii]
MSHKSVSGRFNVMSFGLVVGFMIGLYLYSPPNPENFDENGNWKEKSFIKVRFNEGVAPLEKKPESKPTEGKEE